MSKSFLTGAELYSALRGQGRVLVDVQALEESIIFGETGTALYELMNEYARLGEYTDGKAIALFQRALAGWILQGGSGELELVATTPLQPISLAPQIDAPMRRAGRFLMMIHELHKAGYQRLRIAAGMSPSSVHWRCHITTADNVHLNGWEPANWAEYVVSYSTGDTDCFFGWQDAPGKNARQLAQLFVERFPELAQRGAGQDRAYAGWFVSVLGSAENGYLPVFFADYPVSPSEGEMPPPPCGSQLCVVDRSNDLIANADLRLDHLPVPEASWRELERFCLTYDGYADGNTSVGWCAALAEQVAANPLAKASLGDLRSTLSVRQRYLRNYYLALPLTEDLRLTHAIIEEIRSRLMREPLNHHNDGTGLAASAARASEAQLCLAETHDVDQILRKLTGEVTRRFAAFGRGEITQQAAVEADKAECLRLGEVFNGQDLNYTSVEYWNGEGLANYIRERMAGVVQPDEDDEQIIAQAFAAFVHRIYGAIDALGAAPGDAAMAAMGEALNDNTRSLTCLLLGIEPDE